jgi:transposase
VERLSTNYPFFNPITINQMSSRYSPEVRKIAYEAIRQGERIKDVSQRMGIKVGTLSQWNKVGSLPRDHGCVAPTFRKNTPTSKKVEEETYRNLFDRLPLNNQRFAEHLIQQYEGGIFFAINYAKLTLRQKGNE